MTDAEATHYFNNVFASFFTVGAPLHSSATSQYLSPSAVSFVFILWSAHSTPMTPNCLQVKHLFVCFFIYFYYLSNLTSCVIHSELHNIFLIYSL